MSESNDTWGALVESNREFADAWDSYDRFPEPGENDAVDAFLESRKLDHAAMCRLGAKLVSPTVIAYGGQGYVKFRNVETGEKWSMLGSTFPRMRIIRAGAKPAKNVIVAEGETSAGRLSMLFPDHDIASMPNGATNFPDDYAAQLAHYERVLVALDNDFPNPVTGTRAGEEGWKKIRALLPHAERYAPPHQGKDWCDLDADDLPPLPELPEGRTIVGGVTFEDFGEALAEGVPDPVILVDGLLYDEGVHLFSGHPGCGKTTLVMDIAQEVVAQQRHVVWLDYEAGKPQTLRRWLAMLHVPKSAMAAFFHYAPWPVEAETKLAAFAERWPGALVVVDSMSKVLAAQGIDENDNSQVTGWMVQIVRACKLLGLPVAIIDHITKGGGDSDYSRGAGAKAADIDVHWRVKKEEDFNRNTIGKISARLKKDREGILPYDQAWSVGDGAGGLTVTRTDYEKPDPRQAIVVEMLKFARERPGQFFTVAEMDVKGKDTIKREVAKELAADPSAALEARKSGNGWRYGFDPTTTTNQQPGI